MGRFAVAPVHPSLQAWVPTTPDLACPLCRVRGGTARKDEDHEPFPLDTFRPPFLSFSQFLALERACRATTVVAEDEGDYRQFQDNTS